MTAIHFLGRSIQEVCDEFGLKILTSSVGLDLGTKVDKALDGVGGLVLLFTAGKLVHFHPYWGKRIDESGVAFLHCYCSKQEIKEVFGE